MLVFLTTNPKWQLGLNGGVFACHASFPCHKSIMATRARGQCPGLPVSITTNPWWQFRLEALVDDTSDVIKVGCNHHVILRTNYCDVIIKCKSESGSLVCTDPHVS